MNMKEILTVVMILFAVIDIIGSIPIVLTLKQKSGKIEAGKAALVSLGIMLAFLFVGDSILEIIGIKVSDFAIAGSLILFFIALEMILGIKLYKEDELSTATVVPLAFPLIAGTGTLTTLLSIRAQYELNSILIGIFVNIAFVYLVLKNINFLERLLGLGGISILKKVFGVIVLAIAIKLFRTHTGIGT